MSRGSRLDRYPVRFNRLEIAVALVSVAGWEEEARRRAGEDLPLADADRVPAGLRGHVAVALELGLIDVRLTPDGPLLDPEGLLSIQEADPFLRALIRLRDAGIAPPAAHARPGVGGVGTAAGGERVPPVRSAGRSGASATR